MAIDELCRDLSESMYRGRFVRQPGEPDAVYAARVLGSLVLEAERQATNRLKTAEYLAAENRKRQHYAFVERREVVDGVVVNKPRRFSVHPDRLKEACKRLGLDSGEMRKLGEGDIPNHKGWLRNSSDTKPGLLGHSYLPPYVPPTEDPEPERQGTVPWFGQRPDPAYVEPLDIDPLAE